MSGFFTVLLSIKSTKIVKYPLVLLCYSVYAILIQALYIIFLNESVFSRHSHFYRWAVFAEYHYRQTGHQQSATRAA